MIAAGRQTTAGILAWPSLWHVCRYWTVDPKGDKLEALAVPTALQEALVSHSASLALASLLFTLSAPFKVSPHPPPLVATMTALQLQSRSVLLSAMEADGCSFTACQSVCIVQLDTWNGSTAVDDVHAYCSAARQLVCSKLLPIGKTCCSPLFPSACLLTAAVRVNA